MKVNMFIRVQRVNNFTQNVPALYCRPNTGGNSESKTSGTERSD